MTGNAVHRAIAWILALAAAQLLVNGTAIAQPVDDLERDDSLVLSIAWRLQTANAAYCARTTTATGIQLQDTAVFAGPAAARAAYGLSGDIFIGALALTGPGTAAGLTVNTSVAAIDGKPLAAIPAPSPRTPFARLARVQAMLDDASARDGAVILTTGDGRVIRVSAIPACHVTVEVDDGMNYARSVRDEIWIGRRHIAETGGDHDLLAAMIAHEMAHAVLDHQAILIASHGSTAVALHTEHEADRLSVWLLANAGFPTEAAINYQRTIMARHQGFLAIDPTHGNWRERARIIADERAALMAAPDGDWAHHFRRETE